jgi:hypothetical protein
VILPVGITEIGKCGPVVEQGIWRKRTNQELKELYRDLDIVGDSKKKRFE